MSKKKTKFGFEFYACMITMVLAIAGFALFLLSFSTGYYAFGKMNSTITLTAILGAIAVLLLEVFLRSKLGDRAWLMFATYLVTALLIISFSLLIGDRVEGIGYTLATKFDAGHGGEEACIFSLIGCGCFLAGTIVNVIGSFFKFRKQ